MKESDFKKIEEVKKSLGLAENVKNVFSGILFDIWQWEQEVFDGTHRTFEVMSRIPTVVAIVVTPEGKIIIQRETQPGKKEKISVAGGRAESYLEPWEETVNRELKEELSVNITKFEKLGEWLEASTKNKWRVSVILVTEYDKVDFQSPEEWGEKIHPEEIELDEFFKMAKNFEFASDELFCEFVTRNEKSIRNKISLL